MNLHAPMVMRDLNWSVFWLKKCLILIISSLLLVIKKCAQRNKTWISNSFLIRQRFSEYCSEPGISIFARSITWSYVYNLFTKYLSGRDSNWTSQSNTKLSKRGRSNRSIPHSTCLQQLGLGTFQFFLAVPLKFSSNC